MYGLADFWKYYLRFFHKKNYLVLSCKALKIPPGTNHWVTQYQGI